MPPRQILGLVGSVILFLGVFAPIVSVPIVGNINYFQNGKGDGVIILWLAVISVFLTLTKRYRVLLITGVGSLAVLAFTFINFQGRMSSARSEMREGMANNPFRGLGDAMLSTVQIQWGWAVLIIGAVLLLASAVLKEDGAQPEKLFSFGRVTAAHVVLACVGLAIIGYAAFNPMNTLEPDLAYVSVMLSCIGLAALAYATYGILNTSGSEELAYVNNISVSNVAVQTILDHSTLSGELKNNGNRTLDEVEITVFFLDKEDNPVAEKTYSPVHVSQSNFTMESNSPLKPQYSKKFECQTDEAPSDWAEQVTIKIRRVKFAH
jgi:hypothetical protein